MSKTAFIFPGQGAQKSGMGKDFYENSETARKLFDAADAALDFDLKEICFGEHEEINRTEYTQPAMVTACLAMAGVLLEKGIRPDVTAGLSLGEYAAIAVAGGMDRLDAIRLVRRRGLLMQNTVPAGAGGMAAVLGLDTASIEQVTEQIDGVTIANYNCPGQIVITGLSQAVEEASVRLRQAGAKRVVPLKVSGPFHSPMLAPAGEALAQEMEQITFSPLHIPYIANVTAEMVTDSCVIPQLLAKGVSSPVRWQQSVERMLADGVDTFIEIGPGRTLAGFMKKIDPKAVVYNISSWEDAGKAAEVLC